MKQLLIALAALMIPLASYGQGQVVFVNKVGTALDAAVTLVGTQYGPGPNYTVQLFLSDPSGVVTPLTPASTFRPAGTGAAAIADRYWVSQDVIIPGVPPGTAATFVVRAWKTSEGSFETAPLDRGESTPFTVTVGGGTLPPANLTTLQGFTVGMLPEPSTIALGVLGAVALMLLRRR